jgi:hypothetical protein
MDKKFIFLSTFMLLLVNCALLNAQVTVGRLTVPKATLDVVAIPGSTAAQGVIAPNLAITVLDANQAAYTGDQTGAIVYVNDITGGSTHAKTVNITKAGYYYFDGALWQAIGGSSTVNITGTKGISVTDSGTSNFGVSLALPKIIKVIVDQEHPLYTPYAPAASVFSAQQTVILGIVDSEYSLFMLGPVALPDLTDTDADIGKTVTVANRSGNHHSDGKMPIGSGVGLHIYFTGGDKYGNAAPRMLTIAAKNSTTLMWLGTYWISIIGTPG